MACMNMRLRNLAGGGRLRIPNLGMIVSAPDGRITIVDEILGVSTSSSEKPPDVPGGVWMTNLSPSSASTIGKSSPNAIVLADGWAGVSWDMLLEEWGFATGASAAAVGHLFRVFERVVSLSLQAAMRTVQQPSVGGDLAFDLLSRSSLAAGLNDIVHDCPRRQSKLSLTMAAVTRELHLCGIWNTRTSGHSSDADMTMRAFCPRVGYARTIARKALPGGARWYGVAGERLVGPLTVELVSELGRLNRPIIVKGVFQRHERPVPSWLRLWFAGSPGIYGRTCLTLEEAELVLPYGSFLVQEAIAGLRWQDPDGDCGLSRNLKDLFSVCGGAGPAQLSWSSGVAAENFLRSRLHHPFGNEISHLPENAWLAAHDRIAMIPAIEAIDVAGGRVVSAHAGSIIFRIDKDMEAISRLAASLWKQGFLFPMRQAHALCNLGAAIPIDGKKFKANKTLCSAWN